MHKNRPLNKPTTREAPRTGREEDKSWPEGSSCVGRETSFIYSDNANASVAQPGGRTDNLMDRPPAVHPGILPALRAATSEAHLALEQAVDTERCLGDLPPYTRLLENFLGFYRPLERSLEAAIDWTDTGLDFAGRRKARWLEADLTALGFTAQAVRAVPDARVLPSTDGLPRCFGCLYVLEGATLGGRHISAMMRGSSVPPGARAFFGSYGADTGARWREFVSALETQAVTGTDHARSQIVESANETFACLHRWIHERTLPL